MSGLARVSSFRCNVSDNQSCDEMPFCPVKFSTAVDGLDYILAFLG